MWMTSGTAKQRKCYPVGQIAASLSPAVVNNILGFHALTGCDSTSSLTGIGKRVSWKVFCDNPDLLHGVGRDEDGTFEMVDEFVCKLYNIPLPQKGVDWARHHLFVKGKKSLETLPPTKDALELHIHRANYQAKIWLRADKPDMEIGTPSCEGWIVENDILEPVWSRLPPVPMACLELVSCGCRTKCRTAACRCAKSGQICIHACGCNAEECCNPAGLGD